MRLTVIIRTLGVLFLLFSTTLLPPIAISIETRKEVGESYSAVAGFFRQYELYYVVADERDVIRVRTNFRGEDVYLYPLRTPRDRARRALVEYAEAMNRLAAVPEFYNAGTGNCTTTSKRPSRCWSARRKAGCAGGPTLTMRSTTIQSSGSGWKCGARRGTCSTAVRPPGPWNWDRPP